jgi:hypothetical protein
MELCGDQRFSLADQDIRDEILDILRDALCGKSAKHEVSNSLLNENFFSK